MEDLDYSVNAGVIFHQLAGVKVHHRYQARRPPISGAFLLDTGLFFGGFWRGQFGFA